jgi:hypothetical protein
MKTYTNTLATLTLISLNVALHAMTEEAPLLPSPQHEAPPAYEPLTAQEELNLELKNVLKLKKPWAHVKKLIQLLVEKGANPNTTENNTTAFSLATEYNDTKFIEFLARRSAHPDPYALTKATEMGKEKLIRLLLKYGADPNRPTNDGIYPLMRAKKVSIAKILVAYRARTDIQDGKGKSPAHFAAREGYEKDLFKWYFEIKDDWQDDHDGNTVLHELILNITQYPQDKKARKKLDILLKSDAPLDHRNKDNKRAEELSKDEAIAQSLHTERIKRMPMVIPTEEALDGFVDEYQAPMALLDSSGDL